VTFNERPPGPQRRKGLGREKDHGAVLRPVREKAVGLKFESQEGGPTTTESRERDDE